MSSIQGSLQRNNGSWLKVLMLMPTEAIYRLRLIQKGRRYYLHH